MLLKPAKEAIDIGVIVGDIDRSLAFYRDLLGLEKTEELPTPLGTIHRLAFGGTDLKLVVANNTPKAGSIGLDQQLGFLTEQWLLRHVVELEHPRILDPSDLLAGLSLHSPHEGRDVHVTHQLHCTC